MNKLNLICTALHFNVPDQEPIGVQRFIIQGLLHPQSSTNKLKYISMGIKREGEWVSLVVRPRHGVDDDACGSVLPDVDYGGARWRGADERRGFVWRGWENDE